jgi:hypothetical protein
MDASGNCPICGKRGKRECPATQRLICPACCGSHRGSKLSCPADCSHFPFGTASPVSGALVEAAWLSGSLNYLNSKLGSAALTQAFNRAAPRPKDDAEFLRQGAIIAAIHDLLFVQRAPDGRTWADTWEAEGWEGFDNDAKVMMRYRKQSAVTVIELQRHLGKGMVECVDVLAPESGVFRVLGKADAPPAPRYTKVMGWLTHYPHFSRISAAGSGILEFIWPAWQQRLQAGLAEAQKTRPEITASIYLAEHFLEMQTLILQLLEEHKQNFLASVDLHECKGVFELTVPAAEVKEILGAKPEFSAAATLGGANEAGAICTYQWLYRGDSALLQDAGGIPGAEKPEEGDKLGLVHLHSEKIVSETLSLKKHQFARLILEKHLGARIRFKTESIVDLARQIAQRQDVQHTAEQASLAKRPQSKPGAPSDAQKKQFESAHAKLLQTICDEPVPALDGLTPRIASQRPETRPKLIEWLKGRLHQLDRMNLSEGLNLSLDPVLDELGMPELK